MPSRSSLASLANAHWDTLSRHRRYADILKPGPKLRFDNEERVIIADLQDIHETITKMGPPELADRICGSYLSGSIHEDKTSKTLRISESLHLLHEDELNGLLSLLVEDWSSSAHDSPAVKCLIGSLDPECTRRGIASVPRAMSLSRLQEEYCMPSPSVYTSSLSRILLDNSSVLELEDSPSHLVTLLLLAALSSNPIRNPDWLEDLVISSGDELDSIELSVCLLGLKSLDPSYKPTALESKLKNEYGFVI
eukprot:TRINITY_DN11253_c0_g1_i1.p1 TRINITY_DN11253_c0_g1~~TRINITY_DN11253_c0_g1_i1.p1  ORF type:complete len:251 (+),score=13.92 TRINITY_DN11253_c0_g1_i1:45-797(+)